MRRPAPALSVAGIDETGDTLRHVCAACGERVGAYERMRAELSDRTVITTSLASLNGERRLVRRVWHIDCDTTTEA